MADLKISDLISSLNKEENKIDSNQQKLLKNFEQFEKIKSKKYNNLPKQQKDKINREADYQVIKDEVTQWQPIVKKLREANQVDFRKEQDVSTQNFNQKISLNKPKNQISQKLHEQKLLTENDLKERLEEKLQGNENKEKILKELSKQKHLLLYQEQKARRIKKIKSKLYRRIKRKKEEKKQNQIFQEQMRDKNFALEELEKMEKHRALERASLRHKNKNKYTQQIKRYAGEKNVQEVYKNLNFHRQEINDKLQDMVQNVKELDESSYDEEDFQEEALNEVNDIQNEKIDYQPKDMLDKILLKMNDNLNDEAKEIQKQIQNDELSDMEFEENDQKQIMNKQTTLKKFGKKDYINDDKIVNQNTYQKNQINVENELDLVIGDSKKIQLKNQEKKSILKSSQNNPLLKGIEIDKLKTKYEINNEEVNKESLNLFNQEIEKDKNVFDFIDEKEYQNDFLDEKFEEYEQELPKTDKMEDQKGWGSWTGYGVIEQQRDIDRKKKQEQEQQKKILEIKKRRKDGKMNNVIINPKRVKTIKKYLIEKLPHGYDNKEKFNYEITRQVGNEWNPQVLYKNNIKDSQLVTPGEIIKPLNKKFIPKTKYIQLIFKIIYEINFRFFMLQFLLHFLLKLFL